MQKLGIAKIEESAKHSGREYREVPVAAETNCSGVRVRICAQGKRKSSYDWIRNCLIFQWSHLLYRLMIKQMITKYLTLL